MPSSEAQLRFACAHEQSTSEKTVAIVQCETLQTAYILRLGVSYLFMCFLAISVWWDKIVSKKLMPGSVDRPACEMIALIALLNTTDNRTQASSA